MRTLALGLLLAVPAGALAQDCPYNSTYYTGNTGRMQIGACLLNNARSITGWYWTTGRTYRVYRLEGTNVVQGQYDLNEYTNGTITARITLRKRLTAREVIWQGTMHNTDGRRIPVAFRRPR